MRPVDADRGVRTLGHDGRHEVEANVDHLDVVEREPLMSKDGLEIGLVARDTGQRDRFAREVGGRHDVARFQHHDAVQRMLHERGDGNDWHLLRSRLEDIVVVGDPERIAAGADGLQHSRRVGGREYLDIEPGFREVAAIPRHVDAGVIRVRVPVQRERDLRQVLRGHLPAWHGGGPGEREGATGRSLHQRAARDRAPVPPELAFGDTGRLVNTVGHGGKTSGSCAGIAPIRCNGRRRFGRPLSPASPSSRPKCGLWN